MTLVTRNLCFSHGLGARSLDRISFAVQSREVLCILGPNGSGKTTLLRCLIGGLSITSGQIVLAGQDATTLPSRMLARLMAYVPQGTQNVFGHRVLDIVMMGRSAHLSKFQTPGSRDVDIAMAALGRVGISQLADRSFGTISGGERQLCLLARAVAQDPAVLILDEPAASLDFGNQARILDILAGLADGGLAVVMTTHHPDHAQQIGTHVLGLRDGRIVAEGPAPLLLDEDFLTGLYGTPVRVIRSPDGLSACRPCHSHATHGVS